jgi:hypothetical protein
LKAVLGCTELKKWRFCISLKLTTMNMRWSRSREVQLSANSVLNVWDGKLAL